jgi:hypothetical protein
MALINGAMFPFFVNSECQRLRVSLMGYLT